LYDGAKTQPHHLFYSPSPNPNSMLMPMQKYASTPKFNQVEHFWSSGQINIWWIILIIVVIALIIYFAKYRYKNTI